MKIDFINRDDQDGIKFYYDVAQEAAEHHLMVDFHGASKPWGIERTYPNVLSYEAVLGAENSKVARRDSPVDRSVFPFTRMVAGPLDYTPGGFNNATENEFVGRDKSPMIMGTRAQQLSTLRGLSNSIPNGLRQSPGVHGSTGVSVYPRCSGPVGRQHVVDGEPANLSPSHVGKAMSGIWAALLTGRRVNCMFLWIFSELAAI